MRGKWSTPLRSVAKRSRRKPVEGNDRTRTNDDGESKDASPTMSIITDTLNRLQSERAWRPAQPRTPATTERTEAADFRDPDVFSPHSSPRIFQNRLPWLLVVLGCVGIAAYLWGLPLIAAPDRVIPEPEPVKELNPVQPVPSQGVEASPEQREEPFTATVASEAPKPAEPASGPGPQVKTNPVATPVPVRKPRSSSAVRSTAKPPPAHNVDAASSKSTESPGFPTSSECHSASSQTGPRAIFH